MAGVAGISLLPSLIEGENKAKETLQQKPIKDITCRECNTCAVSCTMGFDISNKIRDVIRVLDVSNEFLA